MKIKRLIFLLTSGLFVFPSCSEAAYNVPNKYTPLGLKAQMVSLNYSKDNVVSLEDNTIELISEYTRYMFYNFNLGYTASFFTSQDLLIFSVKYCSSDEMEFYDILEEEGTLYPLFYRKEIKSDQPTTDDEIVSLYYVEVLKENQYKVGKIIYRFK